MEIWDAYDKNVQLTGQQLRRGEQIPEGLYHLVSEILVRHEDGDYLLMQRDPAKWNFGGYWEGTAGGSALCGEDKLSCAKRELQEECGILCGTFEEIGRYSSHNTHYVSFLCVTSCDKNSVRLQEGETVAYRWVREEAFIDFINSGNMIPNQKKRLQPYFDKKNYMKK